MFSTLWRYTLQGAYSTKNWNRVISLAIISIILVAFFNGTNNGSPDTYNNFGITLKEGVLFKRTKSKFFGYAFPNRTRGRGKALIEEIRTNNHHNGQPMFAMPGNWGFGCQLMWQMDDGEPNIRRNPIYGKYSHLKLTNVLWQVARIFGAPN